MSSTKNLANVKRTQNEKKAEPHYLGFYNSMDNFFYVLMIKILPLQ